MAACVTYPQSAVQDGENNAVQDENWIQDVTYVHFCESLCTRKTHYLHQSSSPASVLSIFCFKTNLKFSDLKKYTPYEIKWTTIRNPHRCRWDWSSRRQRWATLAPSYRAGCRRDWRSESPVSEICHQVLWSELWAAGTGSPGLPVRAL